MVLPSLDTQPPVSISVDQAPHSFPHEKSAPVQGHYPLTSAQGNMTRRPKRLGRCVKILGLIAALASVKYMISPDQPPFQLGRPLVHRHKSHAHVSSILPLSKDALVSAWPKSSISESEAHLLLHPVENLAEDKCTRDLVPWEGFSTLTTLRSDLEVSFGKGNILNSVLIRVGEVDQPMVIVRANVTRTSPADRDYRVKLGVDDGNGGDDGDDDDDGRSHPGLHVDVEDSEEYDRYRVVIYADATVPADEPGETPPSPPAPTQSPGDHRKHKKHRKHRKHPKGNRQWMHGRVPSESENLMEDRIRFCAVVHVEIVLPANYKEYGAILINGGVHAVQIKDLSLVPLNALIVQSLVGDITLESVVANTVFLSTVTGSIQAESLEGATPENRLWVKARSDFGSVHLAAAVFDVGGLVPDDQEYPRLDSPQDDIQLWTKFGQVHLEIASKVFVPDEDDRDKARYDTALFVESTTFSGTVENVIALAKNQDLVLHSKSTNGAVTAKVSDRYEGFLWVSSTLGFTTVEESPTSESKVEYWTNSVRYKSGQKWIHAPDGKNGSRQEIKLSSTLSQVKLEFA